jgi:acyl-CoA synthetase (AMP-forming)/AMP-acid ligase II
MNAASANVVALLVELAQRAPDRPALILVEPSGGVERIGYAELARRTMALAGGFAAEGIRPGDRVLLLVPMSIELYVALFATLAAGAVGVFVDPWVGLRRIAALAADAEPTAVVGTPKSLLLRLLSSRLRRPLAVTVGGTTWAGLLADRTLSELETIGAERPIAIHPATADESALVTLTTGSSGESKGADRTHGFLVAQHAALADELPVAAGEVDLTTFPIFALHSLASGGTALVPPIHRARPDRFDAPAILATMTKERVVTAVASPPFWDRLAAAVAQQPGSRPALRRLVSGGAPVRDEQLRSWRRAFPDTEIRLVYGSTEAEPVASIDADERLAAAGESSRTPRGDCVGRFARSVDARVVRLERGPIVLGADGWGAWEVAAGEIGELVVSGAHVNRRYFRNERAFAENKIVAPDGTVWHRMGDTGSLDDAGRFWLAGRLHSTLFRAGRAVHAHLVEQVARRDPRVKRAAALGAPDRELGQRVLVVVESGDEHETERQADRAPLAESVRRLLDDAGVACDEVVIERRPLPLDPRHQSKIDYAALARRLGIR